MSDFLKEYMKQFDSQREGEKQLRDRAEGIYLRFLNKQERIDSEKATKNMIVLKTTRWEKNWYRKEVRREKKESLSVADWWANSFGHYAQDRGSVQDWQTSAGNLVHAYQGLESYGCLITSGKDEQIRELTVSLDALKQQVGYLERSLRDSEEEGRRKDNRVMFLENVLMKNNISFGSDFSDVTKK